MNQNIICHFVNGYDKKNPILWQFSNMDTAQSVPSSARADYNIDIYEPAKIVKNIIFSKINCWQGVIPRTTRLISLSQYSLKKNLLTSIPK